MGLLGNLLGGALAPPQQQQSISPLQAYREAAMNYYALGTATTTGTTTITLSDATYNYNTRQYAAEAKQKLEAAYRRTVKRGEMRYSDNPLKWLDERVDEMRVAL